MIDLKNRLKHFTFGCADFLTHDKAACVSTCSHCKASRSFTKETVTVVKYHWAAPTRSARKQRSRS